jgi:orotidine-5'-phosphate decarboxylase
MMSFSDRLAEVVRRKGPLCVGIDPRWDMLPRKFQEHTLKEFVNNPEHITQLIRCSLVTLDFCRRVLQLVEPYTGVIKVQAAFFELLGQWGAYALSTVIESAKHLKMLVILDAKRGDIASTATAYADAAFAGCTIEGITCPIWNADALTINPYLGADAVEPFLSAAKASQRGVFVLVRTSNPGSGLFQDLVCEGQPVYRHVARAVANWNESTLGGSGLGDVGAVIGATHPREIAELRAVLPNVWFLVPGYGAQGGSAADVRAAYREDGLGAIVNSSRGVVFPFKPDDADWEAKIVAAARKAAEELKP